MSEKAIIKRKEQSSILMQACQEECNIRTPQGARDNLLLLDQDKHFAMFKDIMSNEIVIIAITDIKAISFKDEEEIEDEENQD
jgi:hypothetical protein